MGFDTIIDKFKQNRSNSLTETWRSSQEVRKAQLKKLWKLSGLLSSSELERIKSHDRFLGSVSRTWTVSHPNFPQRNPTALTVPCFDRRYGIWKGKLRSYPWISFFRRFKRFVAGVRFYRVGSGTVLLYTSPGIFEGSMLKIRRCLFRVVEWVIQ